MKTNTFTQGELKKLESIFVEFYSTDSQMTLDKLKQHIGQFIVDHDRSIMEEFMGRVIDVKIPEDANMDYQLAQLRFKEGVIKNIINRFN